MRKVGGEDDGGDERKDAEESRQAGVLERIDAGRNPEHRKQEDQRGDSREKGRRAGKSHVRYDAGRGRRNESSMRHRGAVAVRFGVIQAGAGPALAVKTFRSNGSRGCDGPAVPDDSSM